MKTPGKIITRMLGKILWNWLENDLEQTQYRFRKGKSTIGHIFIMRGIGEKYMAKDREPHVYFINLERFLIASAERTYGVLYNEGRQDIIE